MLDGAAGRRRVGENRSRPVDVRIVAATHRDLGQEVTSGRFRKDLYYRLRVVEIALPALRERKDDILPLARTMIAAAAERMDRPVRGLTTAAADQLVRWHWPGNVRELENAIERAVALSEGERIDAADLPEEIREALPEARRPSDRRTLADVEREHILAVLDANEGHQGRTAEQLGIGSATLYRKLKAWGRTARG